MTAHILCFTNSRAANRLNQQRAARVTATRYKVHASNLGSNIAALGAKLVDLRLGDVRPLLGLLQLVLQLAELAQMNVSLFFLFDETNLSFW